MRHYIQQTVLQGVTTMRMPATCTILLLSLAIAACTDEGDGAPIRVPGIDEISVYEPGPHLRQCDMTMITRTQSAARLHQADIEVSRSSCGFIEGVAFPAVCGAGTAQILVHDIPAGSLAAAEAAGFHPTSGLKQWRRDKCPQYLHAVEVAQETTSCTDLRNRVIVIQNAADPEQRWALLDQAGACADASYRQVLFGGDEGAEVLCSNADSFAGPQKSCPAAAYAALFDTIVANLAEPDLGLGEGYLVNQVHPLD